MRKMKNSGIEWIGEIPAEWQVCKIKNTFNIYSGATPKSGNSDYWDGDVVWITPADYKTIDKYIGLGKRTLTQDGYNSCGTTLVPENSIIFSKRAPIGSVAISKIPLCTNQGCLACVSKGSADFVFYYYVMSVFTEIFELYGSGTTFKEISFDNFASFYIPYPDVKEQKEIADYLDHKCAEIDSVIEKTKATIEEYKKLKQSVITEAITKGIRGNRPMKFSGNMWYGDIPVDWDIRKIKYMFRIKKDIAGKEGYTVLSITQKGIIPKNISNNEGQLADNYSKYQFATPGDFAMNHMDLLTGWVDVSKYNGVISPDYRVFVLCDTENNCKPYYLYLMQMCYFNKIFYGLGQGVSGMGRWRLQTDKFLNFTIPVPSFKEQQEISNYLDQKCAEIDTLIEKKTNLLTELETYKKSLIYEYVTGKKEVK